MLKRVHMRIRGSLVKPAYDGYIDVNAAPEDTDDDIFEAAIRRARATAHWDSRPSDFVLERIEGR